MRCLKLPEEHRDWPPPKPEWQKAEDKADRKREADPNNLSPQQKVAFWMILSFLCLAVGYVVILLLIMLTNWALGTC